MDDWLDFVRFLTHTQDHHRDEMLRLLILLGLALDLITTGAVIASDLL
ncbi:hypothetical protein ACFWNL_18290 [Kitasatospora sp. NPDC058397]